MQIKCPHCGHINKAPDEYAGRRVICPSCRQALLAAPYRGMELPGRVTKTEPIPVAVTPIPPPAPSRRWWVRPAVFASLSIIIAVATAAYQVGLRVGRRRGFDAGVDAVITFGQTVDQAARDYQSRLFQSAAPATPTPPPQPTAHVPIAEIMDVDYTRLGTLADHMRYSWKVRLYVWHTGSVDVRVNFYDADDYLIHSSVAYNVPITAGNRQTVTETDIMPADLYGKIAAVDATLPE